MTSVRVLCAGQPRDALRQGIPDRGDRSCAASRRTARADIVGA
jgi:hypothetical protein